MDANDRALMERWLAFVQATHHDPYTVETLTGWLERGDWPPKAVDTARRIAAMLDERC